MRVVEHLNFLTSFLTHENWSSRPVVAAGGLCSSDGRYLDDIEGGVRGAVAAVIQRALPVTCVFVSGVPLLGFVLFAGVGVAQLAQSAEEFGQQEGVFAVDFQVAADEWGQSGYVVVQDRVALGA